MPYVNIRITPPGVSPEKKAEVIRRVTQVLVEVLDKKPESTFVVIDEVPSDNWGVAGQTITERRARK